MKTRSLHSQKVIPLNTPDEEDPDLILGFTLLACVSLSLNSLHTGEPLAHPFTVPNLSRLRDDLEADLLTGTPTNQPREDAETTLLVLMGARQHLDAIARGESPPLSGPPDLVAALTSERVEHAIRHTLNVLDTGPLVAQLQA